ncbi:hypothetical protein GCM10009087_26390 [Sphingomonas oligophenolica]
MHNAPTRGRYRMRTLVASLAEMYVQGVSTRKVKAITEELCGHSFSASTISAINKRLDESLTAFARRRLDEPFAYLIIDAKYVSTGTEVSAKVGSSALSVQASGHDPCAKQVDTGSTVHGALDEL